MYVLEDDLKLNAWQFSQRKYLDWETKLRLTKTRIREWDQNWDGQVYVSYSGGWTARCFCIWYVRTVGEEVPAVFSNTGLEFPEITQFARKAPGAYEEIAPRNRQGERIAMRDVIWRKGIR